MEKSLFDLIRCNVIEIGDSVEMMPCIWKQIRLVRIKSTLLIRIIMMHELWNSIHYNISQAMWEKSTQRTFNFNGLIKRYQVFVLHPLHTGECPIHVEKNPWQNKKSLYASIDWLISSLHLYMYCHVAADENRFEQLGELSSLVLPAFGAIFMLSNRYGPRRLLT